MTGCFMIFKYVLYLRFQQAVRDDIRRQQDNVWPRQGSAYP